LKPPWKLIGALLALIPTVLILCAVAAFIPPETTPRIDNLPNGAERLVLQSLRDSISLPVFFVSIAVFTVLAAYLLPPYKREGTPRPLPAGGASRYFVLLVRWFPIAILAVGVSLIGLIFLMATVFEPLNAIRAIKLDHQVVTFESLVRSWSFPRSQIERADIHREVLAIRGDHTYFRFIVQMNNGKRFISVDSKYRMGDPKIRIHETLLVRIRKDLLRN
jgi:hypothetical protein